MFTSGDLSLIEITKSPWSAESKQTVRWTSPSTCFCSKCSCRETMGERSFLWPLIWIPSYCSRPHHFPMIRWESFTSRNKRWSNDWMPFLGQMVFSEGWFENFLFYSGQPQWNVFGTTPSLVEADRDTASIMCVALRYLFQWRFIFLVLGYSNRRYDPLPSDGWRTSPMSIDRSRALHRRPSFVVA